MCNVPIQLNEEVLAAYLSGYGDIEEVVKAKSVNGTAHGNYIFTMCLDRGGFMAIPHTLDYESQVMTVVVEGRKPQCWNCKQLGHFSKSCPQKTTKTTTTKTTTTTIAAAAAAAAAAATTVLTSESPKPETEDHPDKDEEGWTQVVSGGKKKTPRLKNYHQQQPYQNQQQPLPLPLSLLLQLPQLNHQQQQQPRKIKKKIKKQKLWTTQ